MCPTVAQHKRNLSFRAESSHGCYVRFDLHHKRHRTKTVESKIRKHPSAKQLHGRARKAQDFSGQLDPGLQPELPTDIIQHSSFGHDATEPRHGWGRQCH